MQLLNKKENLSLTGYDGLKIALFYAAIFLIIGCYMAYLPIWLKWRGLSEAAISFIFSLPLVMRIIFTPIVTILADKGGNRRQLISWLSYGSLASLLMLPVAPSHETIFACLVVYALLWTSIVPLTETIAIAAVKRSGLDYGRIRLWGSLTFIIATAGGGVVVNAAGPLAALWLVIGASVLVAIAVFFLPETNGNGAPAQANAGAPIHFKDAGIFLRTPVFVIFLLATSAVCASHAVYNTLATLHWLSLGLSPTVIGFLWATGVIAEILLFAYSRRVFEHFSPAKLIVIAAVAAIIRWGVTAFNPPLIILFSIQTLHALTFGAAHLGAIHFLAAAVPERYAATGQGMYAAVAAGIGMGGAYIAAGPLYNALGAKAFLVMAMLGGVSLVFSLLLVKRWHGKEVIAGQPGPQPAIDLAYPQSVTGASSTKALE